MSVFLSVLRCFIGVFAVFVSASLPLYAETSTSMVNEYLGQGKYRSALQEVLDGIDSAGGEYSDMNGLLDVTLGYINNPDLSELTYKQLVEKYPGKSVYVLGLGNTQYVIGKKKEGRGALEKYIAQWPEATYAQDIRYQLAWELYFENENERALRIISDYFNYGGTSYHAYRCEAFALFRMGRYEEAVRKMERILGESPSVAIIPITEELAFGSDKQKKRVIVYNVSSTLAWTYYYLGHQDKARALFSTLISSSPEWVDVLIGLGYVKIADGDNKGAELQFNKALEIYPNYPDALYGLSLLMEKQTSHNE